MAKKQFKAESKRLLDLMINSIYTHKEIFLREIISNASDAIDKLCYVALTDDKVGMNRSDFAITVSVDKENRTLTVSDNGIGMSRKEVKRAINKQILLVFFLPLLMAALHMVFAFEIICNMLLVFGMVNRLLFFGCTAVTFLIFAAAYVVVYRITARTYYRLVEA